MSQEIILSAFAQYEAKLLPAVLSKGERGKTNSQIIGSWLVTQGIDINQIISVDEVVDALYRATVANYPKLLWNVRPKALDKLFENEKVRSEVRAQREQEEFAARAKAADDKKAQDKKDAAAQRQVNELIGSFRLESARLTEQFRTALAARVRRQLQWGSSWESIASDIADTSRAIYDAQDRANEYLGRPQSIEQVLAARGVRV